METISHNTILINHAKWLRDNGETTKADECLKQANKLSNRRKKYEATKLHASSDRMGNAYRVPRSKRA
jgi:hypothetical protein